MNCTKDSRWSSSTRPVLQHFKALRKFNLNMRGLGLPQSTTRNRDHDALDKIQPLRMSTSLFMMKTRHTCGLMLLRFCKRVTGRKVRNEAQSTTRVTQAGYQHRNTSRKAYSVFVCNTASSVSMEPVVCLEADEDRSQSRHEHGGRVEHANRECASVTKKSSSASSLAFSFSVAFSSSFSSSSPEARPAAA